MVSAISYTEKIPSGSLKEKSEWKYYILQNIKLDILYLGI